MAKKPENQVGENPVGLNQTASIQAPNLRALANAAVFDLAKAIAESETAISEAMTAISEQQAEEENEGDLKLALSFKIKWNASKCLLETEFGFSTKYAVKNAHRIDANQPELFDV